MATQVANNAATGYVSELSSYVGGALQERLRSRESARFHRCGSLLCRLASNSSTRQAAAESRRAAARLSRQSFGLECKKAANEGAAPLTQSSGHCQGANAARITGRHSEARAAFGQGKVG